MINLNIYFKCKTNTAKTTRHRLLSKSDLSTKQQQSFFVVTVCKMPVTAFRTLMTHTCRLTFTSVWKTVTGILNIGGWGEGVFTLVNKLNEYSSCTLDCFEVSLNGFSTLKSILHSSSISEFSVSSQCSPWSSMSFCSNRSPQPPQSTISSTNSSSVKFQNINK